MRRRVLIVEDQGAYALALRKMLEKQGHEVRTAADGAAGVKEAIAWVPDAILMDLDMPVMDGFEAATAIRANECTRAIPIMATTALERPEDVLKALRAGFNRYLRKPVTDELLAAQLDELLLTLERRRRVAALSMRDLGEEDAIEIDRDRQQIVMELLTVVRARVDCDLLAIAWGDSEQASLVVAVDRKELPPQVVEEVERRIWGEEIEERERVRLVVRPVDEEIVEGEEQPVPTTLSADHTAPFVTVDGSWAMWLVGGFEREGFTEEEVAELQRIGGLVAGVWQQPVVMSEEAMQLSGDFPGNYTVAELDLALSLKTLDANYWAEVMEGAVGGVRVLPLSSPEALDESGKNPILILADEATQEAFEDFSFERARAGGQRLTTMLVDSSQLSEEPAQMAAYLLMSVMLGIVDSGRTGCLHLQRKGGGVAGTVIFDKGDIAWASASRSRISLLGLIRDVTQIAVALLRDAVRRSIEQGKSFKETLIEAELLSEADYEEALKAYVTGVVGELLKVERPHLLWSANVKMTAHDVSFDGTEVLMSSMFGA